MLKADARLSRRHLLTGAAGLAAIAMTDRAFAQTAGLSQVSALPMPDVRLLPSPFGSAVEINRAYLKRVDMDRLLHNFRKFAGLKPKGELYGGWEQDTIAGHSLGHYLSAVSLMHAQTGDPEMKARAAYIISELAIAQGAQGDGYVAGFLRRRKDGTVVDGKEIFPEIMAGDIRSAGFDLNGCWVPFYNWHKLYAGLFDAQEHCGLHTAIPVAVALGGYIDKVFAALDDDQVQKVLDCEHGGINESFAELYARTKDPRWLKLSERIYHKAILDPLAAHQDILANKHSNTNIPKLIGLARIYEVSGDAKYRPAPVFFWDRVTHHHSFVIGGNGDREYFFEPDTTSKHVTEATCEHCATYNMLKLTRHMYQWSPQASHFDFYERAHFNHVLAQQNPKTGMFTYMTPLFTGSAREWDDEENSWTCCHGTGMEIHSKHGDSIFWQGRLGSADALIVNLYIPATANWAAKDAKVRLDSDYPFDGKAQLSLTSLRRPSRFCVLLRAPGWAKSVSVAVNGKPVKAEVVNGYVTLDRVWAQGDRIRLDLPMEMRIEASDDPRLVSVLRGPLVMAADLGSVDQAWSATDPALVGDDLANGFTPVKPELAVYRSASVVRPGDLDFVPFYSQYERRSAVYFKRFTEAEWKVEEAAFLKEQARQRDLNARSLDVMHLGEMQAERDHNLDSDVSWPGTYRGRNGREARVGGFMSFDMKVAKDGKPAGALIMEATYWGDDKCGFDILIDGKLLTSVVHDAPKPGQFFDEDYTVPADFTNGKTSVKVRFEPHKDRGTGMVFGVRLFTAAPEGAQDA
jgi:DUF1680 family protein